jgi:hypothetical protein
MILSFPNYEVKPRILPFPRLGMNSRATSESSMPVEPNGNPGSDLSAVRDRLFRMIVANQWDRSHGHRAS